MAKLITEGLVIQPRPGAVPRFKRYLDEGGGVSLQDFWTDIDAINSQAQQRLGYDTQKPEALLERIIKSSSDEGSIVLDCFVGSGTTAAVAEKLNRRWVAVDMGRLAVHTTRKRLLGIPQCKPFVVANLGRYERQAWQEATTGPQVKAYLDFVVQLFGAVPLDGFQHLHGTRGRRAVHVGPIDAAVGFAEIKEALDEAAGAGHTALDVLGWEFEMGLHDLAQDEARARGIDLVLRRIPREVMDARAVDSGEVVFPRAGLPRSRHHRPEANRHGQPDRLRAAQSGAGARRGPGQDQRLGRLYRLLGGRFHLWRGRSRRHLPTSGSLTGHAPPGEGGSSWSTTRHTACTTPSAGTPVSPSPCGRPCTASTSLPTAAWLHSRQR